MADPILTPQAEALPKKGGLCECGGRYRTTLERHQETGVHLDRMMWLEVERRRQSWTAKGWRKVGDTVQVLLGMFETEVERAAVGMVRVPTILTCVDPEARPLVFAPYPGNAQTVWWAPKWLADLCSTLEVQPPTRRAIIQRCVASEDDWQSFFLGEAWETIRQIHESRLASLRLGALRPSRPRVVAAEQVAQEWLGG